MEYVGRRVKKEFQGRATFFGSIQAYLSATGFFRIMYDDGGLEELNWPEVSPLLEPPPLPIQPKSSSTRTKEKRRNIFDEGKSDSNLEVGCGVSDSRSGNFMKSNLNNREIIELDEDGDCGDRVQNLVELNGFDLNEDLELHEGLDRYKGITEESSGVKKEMIDLNLDAGEVSDNVGSKRKVRWFDLNVALKEVDVIILDDDDDELGGNEMVSTHGEKQRGKEKVMDDGNKGIQILTMENKEETQSEKLPTGVNYENADSVSVQKKRCKITKDVSQNKTKRDTNETIELDPETGKLYLKSKNCEEPLFKKPSALIDCVDGALESAPRGRRRAKRIESSNSNITLATTKKGLKKSGQMVKKAPFSGQDCAINATEVNNELSPPTFNAPTSEKIRGSGSEKPEQAVVLPPKVELPPSSSSLDLNGISPFDIFSVYAFLRSFSQFLFLSPFEMDDFVTCVKSNDPTTLFDSIHVSLLRTLRIDLQFLSGEGSKSASICLRSLNWNYLDLITWPVFVVQYLLMHSPGYIPGLNRREFEPLQRDYYEIPVSAKVQILQHLCDDVVGGEAFVSEMNRRTLATEQPTKIASNFCVTGEDDIEATDDNGDECCLCKMDGNLICCDGCPAAFHSRCVGVVSSQLPKGDWYCPECSIDNDRPWNKTGNSIRGAELLGSDPYGRQFHSSCDYLLVSESCNGEYSYWFYERNDLHTLIGALQSSPFIYDGIISAICKHWNVGQIVSQVPNCGKNYVNSYEFARTAASIFRELTSKSSDRTMEDAARLAEENVSGQLKLISNRFAEFSWSNMKIPIVKASREKCGWCFYCKAPEDEMDCLFLMNDTIPAVENFTTEILDIGSRNRKNHLMDVICHIICIEDHLQGLLLGPWLNPNYSHVWRKRVLGAADLGSIKELLLELEANLHHRAVSADWGKSVDSAATMGSACHIVKSSRRVLSLKNETNRTKGKCSKMDITPTPKSACGLRLSWWRGGKDSRQLFNSKALPRSLAAKAARQGGFKKILGVQYPDSGDTAKRTRYTAWRAAVETSGCVEKFALQVRELDANIRWNEIVNRQLPSKLEKESRKPVKSFTNVTIRKKLCEGEVVKYLLDFGKKRYIPDIVVKHGCVLEESSSERKRYWLEESHVPLHLLKAFEQKRIARNVSSKIVSGEVDESSEVVKKPVREKGFSYLFSRAERLEMHPCGHCEEDVNIREAVSCHYCKGFFHKIHAVESAGSSAAETTYTCHKCQDKNFVKADAKKEKTELPKRKKTLKSLKQLYPKKRKAIMKEERPEHFPKLDLQSRKIKKRERSKQAEPIEDLFETLITSIRRKKRTPVIRSYWLNGLRLTRRDIDHRWMFLWSNKMLLRFEGAVSQTSGGPKCSLCREPEYKSTMCYVACDICKVWFHGDALNVTGNRIRRLIGFKCHNCLKKRPVICPHQCPAGSNNGELVSVNNAE